MKKIEILKRTITTKEGKSFDAFKAVQKDGKLIDLKFKKEVKNLPSESCFMFVEKENLNVNRSGRYPVVWVAKVEKYEESKTIRDNSDIFEDEE